MARSVDEPRVRFRCAPSGDAARPCGHHWRGSGKVAQCCLSPHLLDRCRMTPSAVFLLADERPDASVKGRSVVASRSRSREPLKHRVWISSRPIRQPKFSVGTRDLRPDRSTRPVTSRSDWPPIAGRSDQACFGVRELVTCDSRNLRPDRSTRPGTSSGNLQLPPPKPALPARFIAATAGRSIPACSISCLLRSSDAAHILHRRSRHV